MVKHLHPFGVNHPHFVTCHTHPKITYKTGAVLTAKNHMPLTVSHLSVGTPLACEGPRVCQPLQVCSPASTWESLFRQYGDSLFPPNETGDRCQKLRFLFVFLIFVNDLFLTLSGLVLHELTLL